MNFARSFACRRDYSQSMKEMEYVSREGYLQEELLTELIAPGFLNQTIYVDINFLLFSPSLLLLLSIMASCLETFEVQVMALCLLTILRAFLCRGYGFRHATSLVTNTYSELNCIKLS